MYGSGQDRREAYCTESAYVHVQVLHSLLAGNSCCTAAELLLAADYERQFLGRLALLLLIFGFAACV